MIELGTVKQYDPYKGFGFIEGDDGEDYFVHVSGLRTDLKKRGLRKGQRVMFDVMFDVKGDRAINVRPK
ncbi:MAG: cold-shock protein [Fidelibacterota bacterium]